MSKPKCAPAIWRKFDRDAKIIWNKFYKLFLFEAKNLRGAKGFTLTDNNCHIIAHNMACEVVWALIEGFKK